MDSRMHNPLSTKHNLRVVTGGQTGVDLAGLRAAQCVGLRTGGLAPTGFKTTAGGKPALAKTFGLTECHGGYSYRTRKNVQESDATLIIAHDMESSGTRLTIAAAETSQKPIYKLVLGGDGWRTMVKQDTVNAAVAWLLAEIADREDFTLNVAGNSSLTCSGIFIPAFLHLLKIFEAAALKVDAEAAQPIQVLVQRYFQDGHLTQALNDNFDYHGELDPRGLRGLIV